MTYRPATPDDADVLTDLRRAFLAEAVNENPDDPALVVALRGFFTTTLTDRSFHAILAIDDDADGRVVAVSGLVVQLRPPSPPNLAGREAYVMNMYTKPSHRRRGLAREILRRLIDLSRDLDCPRLSLHALPAAGGLYESLGFKPTMHELRLDIRGGM